MPDSISYFDQSPIRVELDDRYVLLRRHITRRAGKELTKYLFDTGILDDTGRMIPNAAGTKREELQQHDAMTVVAYIVDWNFTNEQGEKLPITVENVDELPDDAVPQIVTEINRIKLGRTQEEQVEFPRQDRRNGTTGSATPASNEPIPG